MNKTSCMLTKTFSRRLGCKEMVDKIYRVTTAYHLVGLCANHQHFQWVAQVFEDNVLVRELLETRGEGGVLVIEIWVGQINGCDIGVRALASHPKKSVKKGHGEKHVPIYVGGTLIHEGEWLYAYSDGILVSKTELSV
ncbi:hypothetical protein RND71_015300 [Anisodus tanguticus]|uniref:Uncharacterized protein n=1 Tax=Anisodus tanguticus TaxID=243964 RepID=A0AAE1S680_9SOLA|nr:hypothetical protein RND71_015300 [Anisodus tanguticus]